MSIDEDRERDPAFAPLYEAGEGVSEGFEQSEAELIDHASHGDQHAARRVLQDAFDENEDEQALGIGAEADDVLPADLGEDREV